MKKSGADEGEGGATPPVRADARRNMDALLRAALEVFTELGVDAPMRVIAARAGVGVGTLYRHFPQRPDLIKAILRREVDAQVAAASALSESHAPGDALAAWMHRLIDLVGAKRGLGPALHSGDPAYQSLPDYVLGQLTPSGGDVETASWRCRHRIPDRSPVCTCPHRSRAEPATKGQGHRAVSLFRRPAPLEPTRARELLGRLALREPVERARQTKDTQEQHRNKDTHHDSARG
jgi:AcrR family transcriptional regulator